MGLVPAQLILETGEVFQGKSFGADTTFGEVVFTTGMTGYIESLTDPSYAGQILVFTYPLIGNYGTPEPSLWESAKIHASGVVMSSLTTFSHHHQKKESLFDWLEREKVPFLTGVDTRALTKRLRGYGVSQGVITKDASSSFFPKDIVSLVPKVSIKQPEVYGSGGKKIIVLDCGMKENIFRCLTQFPLTIKRVPYDYDYNQEDWDGLFLSNGPGDPQECRSTIEHLKIAMRRKKPIFGICLGAQLMALAAGATTYKLKFGHRGHNQPCMNLKTKQCVLTSQNHGYAIDESTLPADWEVSYRNLNDNSVEGIQSKENPFFAVQFHPEASPGPIDTRWLFETFYEMLL